MGEFTIRPGEVEEGWLAGCGSSCPGHTLPSLDGPGPTDIALERPRKQGRVPALDFLCAFLAILWACAWRAEAAACAGAGAWSWLSLERRLEWSERFLSLDGPPHHPPPWCETSSGPPRCPSLAAGGIKLRLVDPQPVVSAMKRGLVQINDSLPLYYPISLSWFTDLNPIYWLVG